MDQLSAAQKEILDLPILPGMVSDVTAYSAKGRWIGGDGVRFRKGFPEKIGGWVRAFTTNFTGTPQTIFAWSSLDTKKRLAVGTTSLAYAIDCGTGVVTNITPTSDTGVLGTNPLSFTSGLNLMVIAHTAHGLTSGRTVQISGATAAAGLTTGQINGTFRISVINANSYSVLLPAVATSTATGGGSSVNFTAYINPFANTLGSPWGRGAWGVGPFGEAAVAEFATIEPPIWSLDNWGEDLLVNPRGGACYYYDVTSPTSPAVNLTALAGASDVPTAMLQIIVEPELRFALALGCVPIGASNIDPMFVRWPDRGTVNNWTPGPTTTAGGFRLSAGSRILRGMRTRRDIIVFTDTALYALQAVGGTTIFRPAIQSDDVSLIGPLAVCNDKNGVVIWMGRDGFYQYDGRVASVDCELSDRVFDDINLDRGDQIICGVSPSFDEVWWHYPSAGSTTNNRYIVYNYLDKTWFSGSVLNRSAWLSTPLFNFPLAADDTGLYFQENGYSNGATTPASAFTSFIYSGPVQVGTGKDVMFVDQVLPDMSFGKTPSSVTPQVNFKIVASDWAGGTAKQTEERIAQTLDATDARGFRPFEDKLDMRARGRKMSLEISNSQADVFWRLGTMRVRAKADGQR